MLIFHQCGHNFSWNVQSLQNDAAGDGLIVSPVNVEADKIQDRIPAKLLQQSWIDPQFYLPHDNKGKLATYPYFPSNVLPDFTTADYESHANKVARECLHFQANIGSRYAVIPTRYFNDLPEDYLEQLRTIFVDPFIDEYRKASVEQPLLLTIIAKPIHLESGVARDELLSWATAFDEIHGVYLLFDNNFYTKQIKDPSYLAGQLRFINALRQNDLEVHVGYSGIEGILLSVADATSVSVGSYENLRSFGVARLETREPAVRNGPRPRIYSGKLLQWMDNTIIPPLRELTPNWQDLFDDSPYRRYLLDTSSTLNFQRSELYKHYFYVFSRQIAALPPLVVERSDYIQQLVKNAILEFDRIRGSRVFLDSDSDDSHLSAWINALAMFKARSE